MLEAFFDWLAWLVVADNGFAPIMFCVCLIVGLTCLQMYRRITVDDTSIERRKIDAQMQQGRAYAASVLDAPDSILADKEARISELWAYANCSQDPFDRGIAAELYARNIPNPACALGKAV